MIAIETLGERVEDDSICAGDCLSADALEDSDRWQNDPFLTDLLNYSGCLETRSSRTQRERIG